MKKTLFFLCGLAAYLFVKYGVMDAKRLNSEFSALSSSFPKQIDRITRIDSVEATVYRTIVFKYTITGSTEELDLTALRDEMKGSILKNLNNSQVEREMYDSYFWGKYEYSSTQGKKLMSFLISPWELDSSKSS